MVMAAKIKPLAGVSVRRQASGVAFFSLLLTGLLLPVPSFARPNILRRFTIDWERPFNSKSHVLAAHPELNAFDVVVSDEVLV